MALYNKQFFTTLKEVVKGTHEDTVSNTMQTHIITILLDKL